MLKKCKLTFYTNKNFPGNKKFLGKQKLFLYQEYVSHALLS